jgi:formylglycine-generating enzyme required for sulfatase activity
MTLMPWPLSQDYNEAIQSPAANFTDADLKKGEAATNALGIPMPYSGNFADVYQVRCPDDSRWAVKCFTREAPGLRERYQEISAHLKQARLPFTVDFTYLEKGIRVAGKWYPVLKMQWVEGLTLNQFVSQNLDKPAMLEALCQIWTRMATRLRAADVAHCDLQHGNILLAPGAGANSLALKLIDYDGMWVPALAGKKSGEVGHPSYQHPQRLREGTYNLDVDRFPLLLVATALRALKANGKALWDSYDNGDNLLFKETDLLAPLQSHLFLDLTKTGDTLISQLMGILVEALRGRLETVPLLEELTPESRPAPAAPVRPSRLGPTAPPVATRRGQLSPILFAPSRLGPTAPPVATAAEPVPLWLPDVVQSERPESRPAPDLIQPKRKRKARSTAASMKVRIGAIAAAVVIVFGLVGWWLVVWLSPTPTTLPTPPPTAVPIIDLLPVADVTLLPVADVTLEPGESKTIEVRVERQNCKGPIRVQLVGLPKGVKVDPDPLLLQGDAGQITLTATADAEDDVGSVRLQAVADDAQTKGHFMLTVKRKALAEIIYFLDMKLVLIPAGKFTMGSPKDEEGRNDNEGPQHEVEITKPFYMGVYPVTQAEYVQVTGQKNPSSFSKEGGGKTLVQGLDTSKFPVETVSWDEAAAFCEALNRLEAKKPAGWKYALPTEAEWEYACRAETKTVYYFGSDSKDLGNYAWYNGNSESRTHTVGTRMANPWGLYDMGGNVWQWCADYYDGKYYQNSDKKDPQNSSKSDARVLRGGSWLLQPRSCRAAYRAGLAPGYRYYCSGFRVVLRPPAGTPSLANADAPPPVDPVVAAPLSQESFAGEWVNANKDTGTLKRLAISKKGDAWSIEAWGAGGGDAPEIPWKQVGLSFRVDDVGAKSLPYGFATWDFGFKVTELNLRSENEELIVEDFSVFKDKSGRPNYRVVEKFKKKQPGATAKPPTDDAWLRQVAALPADKQVDAVVAELKARNPGFDGRVTPSVENGVVVGLTFVTDDVTDIAPVRALAGLRTLNCSGSRGKGRLADLSPLKDMKLTELLCYHTRVSDLSPLKGMPLTRLRCDGTPVSDLSPLKDMKLTDLTCTSTRVSDLSPLMGMPVTTLICAQTLVSDLSPLKDMKLTYLFCNNTKVSDLSPLKDMKLTYLYCGGTQVSDLSPLKDMKLTNLGCDNTKVSDLSPLKDMKLTYLDCIGTKVSDLSPLRGMPLKSIRCPPFKHKRDGEILRSIKSLETINGKPAKDFWKDVNAK